MGAVAARHDCDGDLKRRRRAQAEWWNTYVWDGEQVLLELDKNDGTVARYTLAPFGYGDLVSQRRDSASRFYHFDAIGTTRALTDASQAVTDTYIHRAFGTYRAGTGETLNRFRYIGKLGYYQEYGVPPGAGFHLRRRYYSGGIGRFVSRDPIREMGGSAYRYVGNRASAGADPGGHQWWLPLLEQPPIEVITRPTPPWRQIVPYIRPNPDWGRPAELPRPVQPPPVPPRWTIPRVIDPIPPYDLEPNWPEHPPKPPPEPWGKELVRWVERCEKLVEPHLEPEPDEPPPWPPCLPPARWVPGECLEWQYREVCVLGSPIGTYYPVCVRRRWICWPKIA